jgi:hypothetical protein
MGLATFNVWIHDKHDPCKISDEGWSVMVTYCNGNLVEWCGKSAIEEAKCGHAEFQLPPGCYVVRAVQWILLKPLPLFYFSEHAIVVVGCDQIACVHLFTPTIRQLPNGAGRAAQFLAKSGKLPPDKVERFVAAGDDLLKDIPETSVDAAHERLVGRLTEFLQKNPPK